jgi:hypothetical protein
MTNAGGVNLTMPFIDRRSLSVDRPFRCDIGLIIGVSD